MKRNMSALVAEGDCCELKIRGQNGDTYTLDAALETVYDRDKLILQTQRHIKVGEAGNVEMLLRNRKSGIVKCIGPIEKWVPYENGALIQIVVTGGVDNLQRRSYYRLQTSKPATVSAGERHIYDVVTRDLSAGGAKCAISEPLIAGSTIQLSMALEEQALQLQGRVLECREEPNRHYVLRLQFERLDEGTQSKLMAYVLKEQSKRLRNRAHQ